MWGCGQCGGVWLDRLTSERVVKNACQASIALARAAAESARPDVQPAAHHLSCPVCRAQMQTERVAKAWLDIDVCEAHGTWYDRGELERVARTANLQPGDWRNAPPAAAPPRERESSFDVDTADVATAVAVEGTFVLIDVLLALFD